MLWFILTPDVFLIFAQLVSTINAACGVVQLIALAVPVFLRWLRKVGAYLRSCGERCGGCFRLIATLLDLHGE
jgi:ABC-type enterobactin transport system permease subunit